jgi:hypothetical protein
MFVALPVNRTATVAGAVFAFLHSCSEAVAATVSKGTVDAAGGGIVCRVADHDDGITCPALAKHTKRVLKTDTRPGRHAR